MKKFTVSVIFCLVIFGGYYVYKHKNRFIYSIEHNETNSLDTTNYQLQVVSLKNQIRDLQSMNEDLKLTVEERNDTIFLLRKRIYYLTSGNESKPKTQSNSYSKTNVIKNPTDKNEKSLPIARSAAAIELKEFFTDRYSNR